MIAIEPLPKITGYLTAEVSGTNRGAQINAEQTGTAVPKSTGDAARARITYLRDGVPVEEWVEIAVEHLQGHADNTPPWRADERSRLYVAASGPIIDRFIVVECDILRAPQGSLDRYSRISDTILGQLHQDSLWTRMVSHELWQGKYDDLVIYFSGSCFGDSQFVFHAGDRDEDVSSSYK